MWPDVQITMAENFGVKKRSTYIAAGCLRDVVENHLFQIVALLAMEAPATRDFGAVQAEKAKVFEAMLPLKPEDLVRGQYAGYRKEQDVARDSDVETFCALRLFIDSWRWAGVPWFLRSGKCMATTATEILVELKPAPQRLFADSMPKHGRANYLRFRLSPDAAIALATRVKTPGKEFVGAAAGAVPVRGVGRAGDALRASAGRRHARQWGAVYAPGRGGGCVGGGRSGAEETRPGACLQARKLGAEGCRYATWAGRELAQSRGG